MYKECRHLTTVQYEQHILQRNAKMEGKKSGMKHHLGETGDDSFPLI